MAAPGLTLLSVSAAAWKATSQARLPRYYWDFAEAKRFLSRGETPYTPAVSLLYGLQVSLQLIMDEGLRRVFARHEHLRDRIRQQARQLGLEPFASDAVASRTVTALHIPQGTMARDITGAMRERGIIIAGGQGAYEDKVIRIGHMGHVTERDIDEVMQALGDVLRSTSHRHLFEEPVVGRR
jgi:aspartate aminotransferase-like enzyme